MGREVEEVFKGYFGGWGNLIFCRKWWWWWCVRGGKNCLMGRDFGVEF